TRNIVLSTMRKFQRRLMSGFGCRTCPTTTLKSCKSRPRRDWFIVRITESLWTHTHRMRFFSGSMKGDSLAFTLMWLMRYSAEVVQVFIYRLAYRVVASGEYQPSLPHKGQNESL